MEMYSVAYGHKTYSGIYVVIHVEAESPEGARSKSKSRFRQLVAPCDGTNNYDVVSIITGETESVQSNCLLTDSGICAEREEPGSTL